MNNTLINALQNPKIFPHAIETFALHETHSAWVITTGEYVYKIKKPVNFGFLDYSTLTKRHHYCLQEVALNRKLTHDIYLDVVAIYGTPEEPSLKPKGEPFEYAVKMRQFSQDNIASQLLLQDKITPEIIDKLATVIADFHQNAVISGADQHYGNAEHIHQFAMDNFSETLPLLKNQNDINQLKSLEKITQTYYDGIKAALQTRKDHGMVRQCHGDMHLNNIVMIANFPVIFDCIEFNEDFIWTDVMGDLGFLIMDLDEHNKSKLAHLLLNRYLEITGDYSALNVLPYFCAYRAMVRAKVDQIRLAQSLSDIEKHAIEQHYQICLRLAKQYLSTKKPQLFITYGFCGSGKSKMARTIVEEFGAIQLRSDVERKRLAGLTATTNQQCDLHDGLYKPENTQTVYNHLLKLSEAIIKAGYSVIIDATFLHQTLREQCKQLADNLEVPFKILACEAPTEILKQRVNTRSQCEGEISDGHAAILEHQLQNHNPLTSQELQITVKVDTSTPLSIEQLVTRLKQEKADD